MRATMRFWLLAGGIIGLVGATSVVLQLGPRRAPAGVDEYSKRSTVMLGGVFRDFEPAGAAGGHPDFGLAAAEGAGRYAGIASEQLNVNGLPVLAGTGRKVLTPASDEAGAKIPAGLPHMKGRAGDKAAVLSSAPGGAVSSADSFSQWFRDVPGVNRRTAAGVTLSRDSSTGSYVFEGMLDGPGGGSGSNEAYTYELSTTFVHDADKDWFIEVDTAADVWVYIDGKLVIDGGAGAGAVGLQDFEIVDGQVVPGQPFAAAITVLGVAFSTSSVQLPVTAQFRAGSDLFSPFGPMADPVAGNLNDNRNPRRFVLPDVYPAGTPVSVTGRSFLQDGPSKWRSHMTVDSRTPGSVVLLLRDGDDVPDIKPFEDQAAAAAFLKDYIKDGRIQLASNQAIYLFEMYTTNLSDAAADFQDLVVLVELAHRLEDLGGPGGESGSTGSLLTPAPSMRQRIDLERLAFLQDGGTHRIQVFIADRNPVPSPVRFETNISTLNLAGLPRGGAWD